MRALAFVLALLVPLAAGAQISFERTYGGSVDDIGHSVTQTADGGYMVAGYTRSFGAGDWDVYLIKTDAAGDTLWTRAFGGTASEEGRSVEQTGDGGYIISGGTSSFGAGNDDVWLIKTDGAGDTVWTGTYGGTNSEQGWSVEQTTDGGYIIAGYTYSNTAGWDDVYLIKTNAGGGTIGTRTYGSSDYDEGRSVEQTVDGGYIIGGSTWSFGAGNGDVYLIKTNAAGDTAWTRTYSGPAGEEGRSVEQTVDGGYVTAGWTFSFGAGSADFYLVKTDAAGDTMWTRTYGGSSDDQAYSVEQTDDEGYIVAGTTFSFGAGGSDIYLVKADADGDTVWTRTYGGSNAEYGYSVEQTDDGGYVIAGSAASFGAGLDDVYLVKTDADGLVGVNHAPDLVDQADTTVAENEYLTFTLEATDPELDTIWFASPDLPAGATLDSATGIFEWTPTYAESGLYAVTFIATDTGGPALADTEQTEITVTDVVGVTDDEDEVRPSLQYLAQNRPNPFGSSTVITYSLSAGQAVSVAVYDVRGALVRELVDERVAPGVHRVTWDGHDERGRQVGSGIYFCRLSSGELTETRRMVLLR